MNNHPHVKRIYKVPLLANIRINDAEKLELFKVTSRDMAGIFAEAHFKIRGCLAGPAITHLEALGFDRLSFYQDLPEDDWVTATLQILDRIKASSLFLYFEDHRLVAKPELFKMVVEDFDALKLDCLAYSFFRASRLRRCNLLPFVVAEADSIYAVSLNRFDIALLNKISPGYYTFSLLSVVSLRYFKAVLEAENARNKIYHKKLTGLLSWLFPYPGYRKVFAWLNRILKRLNVRFFIYDPRSPHNLEKMSWESVIPGDKLSIGLSKEELFANYDDDNGADGESLIKRGLYPFHDVPSLPRQSTLHFVERSLSLAQGERLDLRYHSAVGRISAAPIVVVSVSSGQVSLRLAHEEFLLSAGEDRALYSNRGGEVVALEPAVIVLRIYDECF